MPNTHHLRHTHLPENKFVCGEPETGDYLAEELRELLDTLEERTLLHVLWSLLLDLLDFGATKRIFKKIKRDL